MKKNTIHNNVLLGILLLSVFAIVLWGCHYVFADILQPVRLSAFQTLVYIYVLIGASTAFTFLIYYLFRVFSYKGQPTAFYPPKIPMLFAVVVALLINATVIIVT
ncbi:TPA: hypothetical protein MW242_002901 [Acinetobacter baumannii]|nr:hypothetical protein [Acinetobacter baumannii]